MVVKVCQCNSLKRGLTRYHVAAAYLCTYDGLRLRYNSWLNVAGEFAGTQVDAVKSFLSQARPQDNYAARCGCTCKSPQTSVLYKLDSLARVHSYGPNDMSFAMKSSAGTT